MTLFFAIHSVMILLEIVLLFINLSQNLAYIRKYLAKNVIKGKHFKDSFRTCQIQLRKCVLCTKLCLSKFNACI